eukprot:6197296-Pleurochrysis_carterae.AAC.4
MSTELLKPWSGGGPEDTMSERSTADKFKPGEFHFGFSAAPSGCMSGGPCPGPEGHAGGHRSALPGTWGNASLQTF